MSDFTSAKIPVPPDLFARHQQMDHLVGAIPSHRDKCEYCIGAERVRQGWLPPVPSWRYAGCSASSCRRHCRSFSVDTDCRIEGRLFSFARNRRRGSSSRFPAASKPLLQLIGEVFVGGITGVTALLSADAQLRVSIGKLFRTFAK